MDLTLPEDLGTALDAAGVRTIFDTMSASHRREWLSAIADAKRPETREKRIAECTAAMQKRLDART